MTKEDSMCPVFFFFLNELPAGVKRLEKKEMGR